MKCLAIGLLSASALLASGCTALTKEFRHPGGYSGYLLDERTYDASQSKSLQLLRGAMVLSIAARIGESYVDPQDADAFAKQLADAADEINYSAANIGYPAGAIRELEFTDKDATEKPPVVPAAGQAGQSKQTLTGCMIARDKKSIEGPQLVPSKAEDYEDCAGFFVNFESESARIEARVVRAMLTALPTDKARKFLDAVAKADLLTALRNLMGAGKDFAGAVHIGSGPFRGSLEIVALEARKCFGDTENALKEDTMTVWAAADCMGLSHDELFDSQDIDGKQFAGKRVRIGAFHAVLRTVRTACVALPLSNELAEPDLIESRKARAMHCNQIRFAPRGRPDRVVIVPQ